VSIPPYGFSGEPPAGTGEGGGDLLHPAKPDAVHDPDEVMDDVCVTAQWRDGFEQRSDRVFARLLSRFQLPARMVPVETRKSLPDSWADSTRSFLNSRMRQRWWGE
jgi:hypothetical protein